MRYIFIYILKHHLSFIYFTGSPADKDNLEVGDEILEVNGKSLEDATHTEVISHIHQVIHKIFSYFSDLCHNSIF